MQETCHTPRTWLAKGGEVFLPHVWMGRGAWQRKAEIGLDLGSESVKLEERHSADARPKGQDLV